MIRITALLALIACDNATESETDTDITGGPVAELETCETAEPVACFDDLLLDLSLQDTVSTGSVSTSTDGDDFVSSIDASAGGVGAAASNPWVYVRFTEGGLEKVDISDETSLDSMDWDLGLHRFKIRMNGGSGGPGCTTAGVVTGVDYDDVGDANIDATTRFEDTFYTAGCDLINDSSGFQGSPQLALGPWWEYTTCVVTSERAFIVKTNDGRAVKMTVEQYYGVDQQTCNDTGNPGGQSAQIQLRWAYIQ